MANQEILNFIINELEKYGPVPNENIEQFDFIETGHLDSLSIMKFVLAIEANFNVSFPDETLLSEQFSIVEGLVNLIEQQLKNDAKSTFS